MDTAEILLKEVSIVSPNAYLGTLNVLLLWRLVSVAQVATVWQVQSHQSLVRPHDGLVDLQVGRATTQALHVDTPLLRVQLEGLQSTLLAQQLNRINVLVSTVVTSAGVSLGVFVGHWRAERIEDSSRRNVLGGDEEDGLALALNFLLLLGISIVCWLTEPLTRHTIIWATSGSVSTRDFSISYMVELTQ